MKLYVVICDDDKEFVNMLSDKTSAVMEKYGCDCVITKLHSSKELVEYCMKNEVDIILTDIDMPENDNIAITTATNTSGFLAAKKLQQKYPNTEVVFVSAHEELAYQSFRYKPFSFISKKDLWLFDEDMSELIDKLKMIKSTNMLFPLNTDEKVCSINVNEIVYFQSNKHYIRSYTVNGEDLQYRCGIKEAYKQLAKAYFIYIHRSYLINCRYIKFFDTQNIVMFNNEIIKVTRDREKIKEAQVIFGRYKRRLR